MRCEEHPWKWDRPHLTAERAPLAGHYDAALVLPREGRPRRYSHMELAGICHTARLLQQYRDLPAQINHVALTHLRRADFWRTPMATPPMEPGVPPFSAGGQSQSGVRGRGVAWTFSGPFFLWPPPACGIGSKVTPPPIVGPASRSPR